ncbi:hypothetical protein [Jeotgalibacillus soli]|uniref:Cell wall assembly protein n=1 Tax=Jeotgalibacillus soli TaxID=889306 RepID=A0A0C2VFB1_9BACL|nr:hypothetical protein [Jeotgalibacillus soli]KIL42703.1 cell wall assembly protein [Jeotgalibacillus soli]
MNDIVRYNRNVSDEGMLHTLISVGEDGKGDRLCFQMVDNMMVSKIYICYHETEK